MPFASKRQWRAAMAGHIPGFSKEDAKKRARETKTPFKELPDRSLSQKGKATLLKSASALDFTKMALLVMGRGSNAATQFGGAPNSSIPPTTNNAILEPQVPDAKGPGFHNPTRPPKPGFSPKKAATNPRARLSDAMTKGIGVMPTS